MLLMTYYCEMSEMELEDCDNKVVAQNYYCVAFCTPFHILPVILSLSRAMQNLASSAYVKS